MDATATRLDRRLRACDLDDLPHEWATRYELIAGMLHMSRRPSFEHQAFLGRLRIRIGPPDLAILLRVPPPPRGQKLRTCPDIVVEVLSAGEI
jgi:Uma2 family endonuclease